MLSAIALVVTAFVCRDEDHLALFIELLGRMPKRISGIGKYAKDYFNRHGELRHIKKMRFWPLDKVLTEKYHLPEDEVKLFCYTGCCFLLLHTRLPQVFAVCFCTVDVYQHQTAVTCSRQPVRFCAIARLDLLHFPDNTMMLPIACDIMCTT